MPSPPRVYRLPSGSRLVERPSPASPLLALVAPDGRITLADGDVVEPRAFVLLDALGLERAVYALPTEHTVDDSVFFDRVHHVWAGCLCSATIEWDVRRDARSCALVSRRVEIAELEAER